MGANRKLGMGWSQGGVMEVERQVLDYAEPLRYTEAFGLHPRISFTEGMYTGMSQGQLYV